MMAVQMDPAAAAGSAHRYQGGNDGESKQESGIFFLGLQLVADVVEVVVVQPPENARHN